MENSKKKNIALNDFMNKNKKSNYNGKNIDIVLNDSLDNEEWINILNNNNNSEKSY